MFMYLYIYIYIYIYIERERERERGREGKKRIHREKSMRRKEKKASNIH